MVKVNYIVEKRRRERMKCKCGHKMRLNSKNFDGTENIAEYCADCALVIMALQGEAD